MGKFLQFQKRAGALVLSTALLGTLVIPDNLVLAATEDGTGATTASDTAENITSGSGADTRYWNLVWNDEFSGTTLDSSKWTSMVGTGAGYSGDGWGNNEQEYYTNGENISFTSVDDGSGGTADCLDITAKKLSDAEKSTYGGKSYTSARLWTMDDGGNAGGTKTEKYAKTYGRIESRIKITGGGTGLWPAFWMMPADDVYGTWASSGELDIMETRGSNTAAVDGTIHFGSQWPNNKSIGGHYDKDSSDFESSFTTAEWHTYAVEWLPGEIRWYVDDHLFYQTSNWYSTSSINASDFTYPAPFDQDFYILLNLAVGGNYDGGALDTSWSQADMYVDYVRVYDLADSAYNPVAYDENVTRPVDQADSNLVSGEVGTNYAASALASTQKTTGYPAEADKTNWFVSELEGGAAGVSMADDALKVNVTNGGNQNYSVQLIHNVPLTKGWRYVMTFDAKADAAKTITAKFGNIGGYPAYSDTYNVDLTTDWKTYTYVFDMASATDADGRIEFNMGQSSGACYFKNFSIASTGQTPQEDPDAAKSALSDGNHIYNGTFDQGTGRTMYWHVSENTAMSVDSAARELTVAGTSESSSVYQKGMNLLKSDSYRLTFDAKAQAAGTITARLLSKDMQTVYDTKQISIGTEYTADDYTVDFVMSDELSDTEGVIEFVTGNNTVVLDNVRMVRTTSNNLDWSGVEFWPLYNYDFYNGTDGWNIWSETGGWIGDKTTSDAGFSARTSVDAGANFWCIGVQSSAMSFTGGIPYNITVNLNGNVAKKIKIETPDGKQADYDFAAGDNSLVIPFTPSSDVSGKVVLYLGTESGEYKFTLKNIDVGIDTSKLTVPEGYARPGSVRAEKDVKAGSSFVILHNNDNWASKITAAYINGEQIDASLVNTTQSGKIEIDGSVIPSEGTYSVKFDATGYTQTKAVAQKVLPASGNTVVNGTFNTNMDGWVTWFNGIGSMAVVDGQAVMTITGNAGNNWDAQLKQENINLSASPYYVLSFDAYSDVERPIDLEFGALGTASTNRVQLTKEKKTYYVTFSNVAATSAASILFMGGNVNGFLADFNAVGKHNIYFDNVVLKTATESDVKNLTPAAVSLTAPAVLGKETVLSYTENTTWENKAITVSVDGTKLADSAVTIDKTKNTITLAKSAYTKTGLCSVAVKAEGYEAQTLAVNVIKSEGNLAEGSWSTWKEDDEAGKFTAKDNAISLDFEGTYISQWSTPEFWSMQASKQNIVTEAGKTYKLTFDAELAWDSSSTADRNLIVELGKTPGQKTIAIHPGKASYEVEVTPGASTDYYVSFMLGGADLNVLAHTLNITNITFRDVNYVETEEPGTEEPVEKVNAAAPSITKQPAAASYQYGVTPKALTVTATSSDKGTLSYQWYKNSKESTAGASAIANATSASYSPAKTSVGTTWYFCRVTNKNTAVNGSQTAVTDSKVISVSVTKASNTISGVSTKYAKTYGDKAFTLKAKGTGTITYTSSNTKVASVGKTTGKITIVGTGTATIKIAAAGSSNYASATKSITITVKPKKETAGVKSKTAKAMTVTWKKDKTATGYQIQYSTSKTFKNSKTVKVTKNTTVSKTLKSLKAGQKYYVRVCAYKTSGKTTLYGTYSTAKTVTVKK